MSNESFTIERNGGSKSTVADAFGKLSKENKGVVFQTLKANFKGTDAQVLAEVAFYSPVFLEKTIDRTVRRIFGDLHIDNIDKSTGLLNLDAWKAAAVEFDAGAQTLGDLQDEKNLLSDKIMALTESPEYDINHPDFEKVKNEVYQLGQQIKGVSAQMKQIQIKYAAIVAAREAAKAATATAPATV